MQTQLMQPAQPGIPWLERYAAGADPERTPLQSLPFSIGRVDSADLQIVSTRVSREHAVIVREGDGYRIRDCGSTNGTFVNGERIEEEVPLNDGDLVVIADCEYTFVAGKTEGRHCVTQEMPEAARAAKPVSASVADPVLAIRRLQEQVLTRGWLPRLGPIVDLERSEAIAYRVETADGRFKQHGLEPLIGVAGGATGALARARQLYRQLAVEAFVNLAGEAQLLLDVGIDELDHPRAIEIHLLRMRHLVGAERLLVGLSANAISDNRQAKAFRDRLLSAGFGLAYVDFLGGKAQIQQFAEAPPKLLLLAANAVGDLASPRQQRQLASIAEACRETHCQPVAIGLRSRADEESCLAAGVSLAASDRAARPASTSSRALAAAGAPVCLA